MNGEIKEKYNESLIIYAIVNSLTQADTIKNVQILIEGKNVDSFKGFNILNPIDRNDNIKTTGIKTDTLQNKVKLKLYFVDTSKPSYEFATEIREISIPDKAVAKAIINELLKGSKNMGRLFQMEQYF